MESETRSTTYFGSGGEPTARVIFPPGPFTATLYFVHNSANRKPILLVTPFGDLLDAQTAVIEKKSSGELSVKYGTGNALKKKAESAGQ